jgi:hypothetical protein
MDSFCRRQIQGFSGIFFAALLVMGCSGDGMGPVADLKPFVGVWEARSLSVVNPDDPSQRIDLVEQGAAYALSVLSTGQYTAVYDLILARGHEAGTAEVSGDQVTLTPTSPPGPATSGTYLFVGDTLRLYAVRLVDYDFDGVDEVIDINFDFLPRESGGS